METKKYIFNENGVCENPDKVGEMCAIKGHTITNYIEIAQSSKGLYGYGLYIPVMFDQADAGGEFLGVSKRRCVFETKEEAVLSACKYLKSKADLQDKEHIYTYSSFDRRLGYETSKPATTKNLRLLIEKVSSEISQLTLF